MGNTISCLDFRKSLHPYQPPARMQLLTGEGPETNDQFGVALLAVCPLRPVLCKVGTFLTGVTHTRVHAVLQ